MMIRSPRRWFALLAPVFLALLVFSACCMRKDAKDMDDSSRTGFVSKVMQVEGKDYRYMVHVPPGYDASAKWPLILFLHGKGERGDDGVAQTKAGIGPAIRKNPDLYSSAIVLMPQCPDHCWWVGATEYISLTLEKTCDEFSIDPDRIYLTGLSMGGFGSWMYGADHADIFAAVAPICGGGRASDAERLVNVPTWVFHGAADNTVPVEFSRRMVDVLRKKGGNVRYTEYPGVGHNSWDNAYNDPEFAKWLLEQRKPR
jgi:predicted peptidase